MTAQLPRDTVPEGLDPQRVREEIALRLVRHAQQNLAGTPYTSAAALLDHAWLVLGPATNGLTGPEVDYARRYVEAFLDRLAEAPAARPALRRQVMLAWEVFGVDADGNERGALGVFDARTADYLGHEFGRSADATRAWAESQGYEVLGLAEGSGDPEG